MCDCVTADSKGPFIIYQKGWWSVYIYKKCLKLFHPPPLKTNHFSLVPLLNFKYFRQPHINTSFKIYIFSRTNIKCLPPQHLKNSPVPHLRPKYFHPAPLILTLAPLLINNDHSLNWFRNMDVLLQTYQKKIFYEGPLTSIYLELCWWLGYVFHGFLIVVTIECIHDGKPCGPILALLHVWPQNKNPLPYDQVRWPQLSTLMPSRSKLIAPLFWCYKACGGREFSSTIFFLSSAPPQ